MPELEISFFGIFEAYLNGKKLTRFDSDKTRALLIYLVIESPRAISREKLAGLFWPNLGERRAKQNLSQALYTLRKLLESGDDSTKFLNSDFRTVQFTGSENYSSDHRKLIDTFSTVDQHPHRRMEACSNCIKAIQSVIHLYEGVLLDNFYVKDAVAFEEWLIIHREIYQQKIIFGLQKVAEHYFLKGEYAEVVNYSQKLVAIDPWQESAYRRLMIATTLSGRREEALRLYDNCRKILAEDFGVEPEKSTQDLFHAIQVGRLEPYVPARTPTNLPAPMTPFIGRKQKLTELESLINHRDCRLISVVGTGGSGKTRLSIEAGRLSLYLFPQGVYFIPLAEINSIEEIPVAIASAINFTFRDGLPIGQQILDYFRDKSALLIFDNFEHLLKGGRWLINFLEYAESITAIVTSRARLKTTAENVIILGGLSFPDPAEIRIKDEDFDIEVYSAPRLFLRAARRAFPGFRISKPEITDLAELCKALDGMPLALILAVPWLNTMSAREILENIQKNINFLTSRLGDLPSRQHSLQAMCEQSWKLLSGHEQKTFLALIFFQGPFSTDTAMQLFGVPETNLSKLHQHSFLTQQKDGRYAIHEVLRHFGRSLLDKEPDTRNKFQLQFGQYFLGLLKSITQEMKNGKLTSSLDFVGSQLKNIAAAWRFATDARNANWLDDAIEGLGLFFTLQSLQNEGKRLISYALERPDFLNPLQHAHLLLWLSVFYLEAGEREASEQAFYEASEALNLTGDLDEVDFWMKGLLEFQAAKLKESQDRKEAEVPFREAITHFAKARDLFWESRALNSLGILIHNRGRFQESDVILEKSIQIHEQIGDPRGKGLNLLYRGYNAIRTGNIRGGFKLLQDGSNLLQQHGGSLDKALAVSRLGNALTWVGKHDEASPLLRKGRNLYQDLGAFYEQLYTTILLGYSEVAFKPYGEIRRYLLDVLPIAEERKHHREKALIFQLFGFLDSAEGPTDQTISLLEESTELLISVKQMDDLAWTTAIFALTYMRKQMYAEGKKKLIEALQLAAELNSMVPALLSLPSSIILFIQRGRLDRAFTLYEVIRAHPTTGAQPRWWNDVCGQEINEAASMLSEPTKEKLRTDAMAFAKNIPGLGKNLLEELESLN